MLGMDAAANADGTEPSAFPANVLAMKISYQVHDFAAVGAKPR